MRIKRLNLYTDQLEANKDFYAKTLGLGLHAEKEGQFSVMVGWSELSFTRSPIPHTYHYCFLIPSNKIIEALDWMQGKTPILDVEKGRKVQRFDSWNADSFYFHDGSGNLAECIARHDLKNTGSGEVSGSDLLGLNEIGMPTADIEKTDKRITELVGTSFWKGDLHRFGTHGDQEGLFLLPNYRVKKTWFPTQQKIKPEPFEALVEHRGTRTFLLFKNERVSIKKE